MTLGAKKARGTECRHSYSVLNSRKSLNLDTSPRHGNKGEQASAGTIIICDLGCHGVYLALTGLSDVHNGQHGISIGDSKGNCPPDGL